jgi:hypothetical protein
MWGRGGRVAGAPSPCGLQGEWRAPSCQQRVFRAVRSTLLPLSAHERLSPPGPCRSSSTLSFRRRRSYMWTRERRAICPRCHPTRGGVNCWLDAGCEQRARARCEWWARCEWRGGDDWAAPCSQSCAAFWLRGRAKRAPFGGGHPLSHATPFTLTCPPIPPLHARLHLRAPASALPPPASHRTHAAPPRPMPPVLS